MTVSAVKEKVVVSCYSLSLERGLLGNHLPIGRSTWLPLLSGWNTLKGNPHSLVSLLKWELRFSVPKGMDECGVVPSSAYGVHANLHLRVRGDFL